MQEALGVIDSIESLILDGKKIPFSQKVAIDEKHFLSLIDKVRRLIISEEQNMARKAVDQTQPDLEETPTAQPENGLDHTKKVIEAEKTAIKIKEGANDYADQVLSQLQLSVIKLQKNLIRVEKNIEDGRMMIDQAKLKSKKTEAPSHESKQS